MNQVVKMEERQLSPSQQFRVELEKMGDQFAAALPSHIKPEKFQRVVMTAVISDPEILRADRKSLMESAIRAAQDGLLPDKREGAFVVFNTKVKDENGKDKWIKAVQWMPMVGGIIKRIHQSGDIKMLTARVVYGGDHFRTWIDDTGEHVEYEPAEDQDTDVVRRVFAMATTVDGAVYVEPLSVKDVEKIRAVSRGKERGPWADWWEEMAKKSAIRRLAKRLPLSVDMHDLIQRDNGFFDLERQPEPKQPSVMQRLQAAREASQEAADEQEGFSRDFVQTETENALTGEILPNNNIPQSGPSAPMGPAEAEDSTVPAASDDAPPLPSSSDALYFEWLLNVAKMLWAATNFNGDMSVLKAQKIAAMASYPKPEDCPALITGKAESVYNQCKQIVDGALEKEDGLALIAGIVGVDQDDIGRAS
jgi:recombination protein RecT